jgi:hypothetical protein
MKDIDTIRDASSEAVSTTGRLKTNLPVSSGRVRKGR